MKRVVSTLCLILFLTGARAQVRDAFSGILPVTDPQMKRSLNSEWQLKVVEGIADEMEVPNEISSPHWSATSFSSLSIHL